MDIGQRKDALVVTERKGQRLTLECDCGKTGVIAHISTIKRFSSCGCKIHLVDKPKRRNHPHYSRWQNIIERCTSPTSAAWHNYGGRGIKICDTWRHDFDKFCRDIGDPPSEKHEIDRIDNDGDYAPGNVRWVLRVMNQRNQRRSCFLKWKGVEIPLIEACVEVGVDYFCAHGAYRKGNEKLLAYLKNKGAADRDLDRLAAIFHTSKVGRVTPYG